MPRRSAGRSRSLAEALALVALCLAVYLPGLFSTPPIDRDESRFAQASRQMFEAAALPEDQRHPEFHAGGLVVPMVQDVPRLNKPPLIYWLQAGSAWIFTGGDPFADAIWMYRIPSVLGAILAVLATWRMGLTMFDRRAAWLGAALLGVSAVVIFDAHQARADQVLLGLTTLAMAQLWTILRNARLGRRIAVLHWITLWIAVGLGVLVKGLSPVVVVLTLVALGLLAGSWRDWKTAKPLLGMLIVAAVVAPWILGVARHVGFENYLGILFDETVDRGRQAKEGHAGPPGYHALLVWAVFWPGALFVAAGVARAFRRALRWGPKGRRWKDRAPGRFPELFLLAWIAPTWLFFEVYSTKLPHYVLPTYPALALLSARAALAGVPVIRLGVQRAATVLYTIVGVLVPIGGVVIVAQEVPDRLAAAIPLALLMLAAAVLAASRAWKGSLARAVPFALAGTIPLAVFTHAVVLPKLTDLSPRVVAQLEALGADTRTIACTGYHEDSLIFLTRGRIQRISHIDAPWWLRERPDALVVLRPQDRQPDDGFGVAASIEGYHFANGRHITVEILENPR